MVSMSKRISLFLSILCCCRLVAGQSTDYNAVVSRYVQQYKSVAIEEMKVYRVPASITLAQGILESNAGRSDLAVKANNHFGIKCHKEWTGMTFYKDDETKNECFRKYETPVESFRDHSWFLTRRERYKGLFDLKITDYKGWANGLKSAGYATNPHYAQMLIKTIETYLLDRFDKAAIAGKTESSVKDSKITGIQPSVENFVVVSIGPASRNIYENNRLRMIIATADDNIYVIARDFNISVGKLLKYNDLPKATAFKPEQIVYLSQKRRKGEVVSHKVKQDESLYTISQLYGLRLKILCKRNDLREGAVPKAGTILRLR